MSSIHFPVTIKSFHVVRKEKKEKDESGAIYLKVRKLGKVSIEFDADGLDREQLATSIREQNAFLVLADAPVRHEP